MKKTSLYQWIGILIFFLFLIILIAQILSRRETFDNTLKPNCPPNSTSYCAFDHNANQCKCVYQKDDARLQLWNDASCCDRMCSALPKEKCIANEEPINYYCLVGGKCQANRATIKDSQIMANICGVDSVTNQYIAPFSSKEECEARANVCDKYNAPGQSQTQKKDACLKDTNCGWCSNAEGEGKCIPGTPLGPNDLDTYYFCTPSKGGTNKGAYEYGSFGIQPLPK